jgi:autotransporter passenger strand-loop-strand repeat protein
VLSGNVLQVTEGGVVDDLQLDPSVNYSALFSAGNSLVLLYGSNGGTDVTIGQVQTVSSGSVVSGATLSSGTIGEVFGSVVSTTIAPGGLGVVFSGGTASATTISGADAFVCGTDTSATLVSGGKLRVLSGGTGSGDTVGSGGTEIVFSGGVVSRTTVNEAGALTLVGARPTTRSSAA